LPVVRNNGNKICARLGIIVSWQPDRFNTVFVFEQGHLLFSIIPISASIYWCSSLLRISAQLSLATSLAKLKLHPDTESFRVW